VYIGADGRVNAFSRALHRVPAVPHEGPMPVFVLQTATVEHV